MRVLHTSDWHLGKKLGRHDRSAEQAEVLDEVIEIADLEAVDLVLVSGDLFDRPFPPIDALRLGLDALQRLSDDGRRPTVAIAGNHDSPELFELLAPLLAARQVYLVGAIKRPQSGGLLELQTAAGRALVACLPFLREGRVVDFLAEVDSWYGSYADRLARLCQAYDVQLTARAAADPARSVTLLCAHFMIDGVRLGGHGRVGRGERPLHIGEAYMATSQAVPPGVQYVALGHIHAPQPAPGAAVASEYAGSLLELDFGEAGEKKRVVIVEIEPGLPASPRSIPLTRGRRLLRAAGRFDELVARPELQQAFVDLTVKTDGPDPGLGDRAREAFPYLVRVAAAYPTEAAETAKLDRALPWDQLFADYYQREHEAEPSAAAMQAFREILDEVEEIA